MLLFKSTLIFIFISVVICVDYEVPSPKFELLKPMGFRVTIPDEAGIQLFAFHGNVNKEMDHLEAGQMSKDIIKKTRGKWVYENRKIKLKLGDQIYYWLFVIKSGRGYRYDDGVYTCNYGYKKSGLIQGYHHKQKREILGNSNDESNFGEGHGYGTPDLSNRGYFPSHSSFRRPRFPPYHPAPFEVYGPPRLQPGYGRYGPPVWGHYPGHHNHRPHHHHHSHHHCGGGDSNENSNEHGFPDDFEDTTETNASIKPELNTKTPEIKPDLDTKTPATEATVAETTPTVITTEKAAITTTTTETAIPDIDIRFGGN